MRRIRWISRSTASPSSDDLAGETKSTYVETKAREAELGIDQAKIDATWQSRAPIFTERERTPWRLAAILTEDDRAIGDLQMERWKEHFNDEELVELGAFMALAHGLGKPVEMLGMGQTDRTSAYDI